MPCVINRKYVCVIVFKVSIIILMMYYTTHEVGCLNEEHTDSSSRVHELLSYSVDRDDGYYKRRNTSRQ